MATGTGSGKTECFLLPVLDDALQNQGALATAQTQDPAFDSRTQKRAYIEVHPKLMLDRGHFNLRTPVGQSIDETLSALFTSDGYEILRNESRFGATSLHDVRILVIAAAGGGSTYAAAGNPSRRRSC